MVYQVLLMVAMTGQLPYGNLPGYAPAPAAVAPRPLEPAEAIDAARVADTTDATSWALQDLLLRPEHDRPFYRYLWIPPWGDVSWHHVNSFIVNSAISQSGNIILPEGAAGGWLIVWDLRRLAPKAHDLVRIAAVWDALVVAEPYFHVKSPTPVRCRQFQHIDGKTYNARHFVPAPHVAQGYVLLENETRSFAPLLRADHFLRRVSTSVDDGLYYHFMGFIRGGHKLTEAEIFRTVGLDVLLSRAVEGDDRAGMFQSGVTEKPRIVEQVQGAVGRARITYDVFDDDKDAARHAIYNLLDGVDKARGKEIIFERANGLHGWILTDGKGVLVTEAPPQLAADRRSPEPVTTRLAPPLSCIRCHATESGVRTPRNDVPKLLANGQIGGIDLFDDLSSKAGRFATVDRLAGLYGAGDKFDQGILTSRIAYADAVWAATRGAGVVDSEQIVPKVSGMLADQLADYLYPRTLIDGAVNADRAALEWGYKVEPGSGAAFLKQAMRPRATVLLDGVPVAFADPSIGALQQNMTIRRQDAERVHALGAFQIQQYRELQAGK